MTLLHAVAPDGCSVLRDSVSNRYLVITESGSSISDIMPAQYEYSKLVFSPISAFIGTIKMKLNKYMVVATSHEVTGSILGREIAKVTNFSILLVGVDHSVAARSLEESQYVSLLTQHLNNATLFFSIGNKYDLTNSLQRQLTSSSFSVDSRFWWNSFLSEEVNAVAGSEPFISHMIYGYFKSHSAIFDGISQPIEFALLTRRSIYRAGTRYFRRGVDDNGNVANFNETEQFFTTPNGKEIFSFLQTRGSVPVFWSEINNLKYKPNLVISSKSALDATQKHFDEQVQLYGDNYCVNLVNQSGYEKPVKDSYEAAVENLPPHLKAHVKYIYFDFHHECRKMRWDRVKLLFGHLNQLGYHRNNYFHYDVANKKTILTQSRVVRTNCMDCLDRTNVVQSTLGRWVLQGHFEDCGYINGNQPWETIDPQFNLFFQSFWADNADAVSCAYSGTGALKTDYTRTGKRTKAGALNDLSNSITRYYKNNYRDGARQDSYDLFLGNYRPYRDSIHSPFTDRRTAYTQLLPYFIGTSFIVLLAVLFFPKGSVFDFRNLLIVGLCCAYLLTLLRFVVSNGYQFVNWPKLNKLDYLKSVELVDKDGRLLGVKYAELDQFRSRSKKSK
ncbi:uncharacterized protein KQ657_002913 [Scheffersomyces spartinae]|uniref:SAC domain-containing protein n=1 Tax=Scheffersomyces spartinae TaxID=45513 RepID=A0A9P7V662_9ASCO|nr:uncharacterized protein KQ657_002913 [Scheffersomyces spartinae]KAG7191644.1 hypothetical protein KQ657_002913 [Scheffersomyces spartinae]